MENKDQIDTIIKQMKALELKTNELSKEIERLNIKVENLEQGTNNNENNPSNTKRIDKLEKEVRRIYNGVSEWMYV